MKLKNILALNALAAALMACGGGDVVLQPTNIDNSVDNSVVSGGGSGDNNPCANYALNGQTFIGSFDGNNCFYDATFVGVNKPLMADLNIPFISGVHIFESSLFVGEDVTPADIAAGTTVPRAGDGPTLTIAAGNKLAFSNPSDYVRISRGSRIIANGTSAAPIIFSGYSDLVTNTAAEDAVSLWGGIMINGNGITNNCTEAERTNGTCSVQSEGQESYYGGNDNTESSGSLRYVVVKHSGFAVVEGDELNGITFNAVGAGTTVDHVQVYNTFDDGFEFFGGAVNVSHAVLVNVRDDSLDFSDGYVGKIQYALIKHAGNNGNRCIEGDNISDKRPADAANPADWLIAPISHPVFSNLTCITSGNDNGTHGDSEGFLLRHGAEGEIYNSIVVSPAGGNECFEINSTGTVKNAEDGKITVDSTILACSETVKNAGASDLPAGSSFNTTAFFDAFSNNFRDTEAASVLDGIFTADMLMASAAAGGGAITVNMTDVSTLPENADMFLENPSHFGAVTADDDWTAGWTLGLE
ncbi:hypothetical protein [Simiduia agarivorans]|uniref:Lipoprotein n=1 Tax=Simiduia agarivorans (strain DSM 21679 / JCM 13881 / BCRC 17597 / SA1) TaxID=1117647 RepID=K4KX89_SIMAS|nr:hypothetical protein [Simiduia agarivorans]AFU98557.1 putative lipoprotein [Simiduia agarivorans SA1 = DSM 21679]